MNNKILLVICLLEACLIGYLISNRNSSSVAPEITTEETKRDSIVRDSIYIINDSIRTEIKYIKEQYKKDSTVVMSSNDSVLFDIFSRYIEDYNNK